MSIEPRNHKEVSDKERKEIKEFAKKIYLEADVNGNHVYTLKDVAAKLLEVFGVKYSHIAVFNWAKEGKWQDIFETSIAHGEKKAIDMINKEGLSEALSREAEIKNEQEYKKKLAQIKKGVYLSQAYAAQRAKQYLDTLPLGSGKIPNAVRSLSEANKTLFDMLEKSPFAQAQNLTMNIQVINEAK